MSINGLPNYPATGMKVVESTFAEQFFLSAGEMTTLPMVLTSGQVVKAGAILGIVTATGKLVECDKAAGDGSEVPRAFTMSPIDASAGDEEHHVVVHCDRLINHNALKPHASWTDPVELRTVLLLSGFKTRTPVYSAI